VLSATIHPDIKRILISMAERTGMTVSQVADEVLYTGLIEMQELDARAETSTAHSWCEEIRKVIPQNKHQNGHKI
jgi:phosphohistidine phosphatase SixA